LGWKYQRAKSAFTILTLGYVCNRGKSTVLLSSIFVFQFVRSPLPNTPTLEKLNCFPTTPMPSLCLPRHPGYPTLHTPHRKHLAVPPSQMFPTTPRLPQHPGSPTTVVYCRHPGSPLPDTTTPPHPGSSATAVPLPLLPTATPLTENCASHTPLPLESPWWCVSCLRCLILPTLPPLPPLPHSPGSLAPLLSYIPLGVHG